MLVRDDRLFRPEAIEYQRRRLSGNVVLRPGPSLATACAAYGVAVCALGAAFAFASFPVRTHASARCAAANDAFVAALHPRFAAGTVLRRAEIDAPNGTPLATWESGRYARRASAAGERCTVTYELVSRPGAAMIRRFLHGS